MLNSKEKRIKKGRYSKNSYKRKHNQNFLIFDSVLLNDYFMLY